eukprot:399321-Prorocentrum_minimum.AAC.1
MLAQTPASVASRSTCGARALGSDTDTAKKDSILPPTLYGRHYMSVVLSSPSSRYERIGSNASFVAVPMCRRVDVSVPTCQYRCTDVSNRLNGTASAFNTTQTR